MHKRGEKKQGNNRERFVEGNSAGREGITAKRRERAIWKRGEKLSKNGGRVTLEERKASGVDEYPMNC